jgi:hypothetical protein
LACSKKELAYFKTNKDTHTRKKSLIILNALYYFMNAADGRITA